MLPNWNHKKVDVDNLQDKMAELLHEIEVKELYTQDDPRATKRMFLEIANKQSGLSALGGVLAFTF